HVDQFRAFRYGHGGRGKEEIVQAATDHVDLFPVADCAPSAKLAASELADGRDEGGVMHLLAQTERPRRIEFLGSVNGYAVWGAAEQPAEQCHGGRIGAEVNVEVVSGAS